MLDILPVDHQTLAFAFETYSAAYRGVMPTEDPSRTTFVFDDGQSFHLTDVPLNRAMGAMQQTTEHLPFRERMAVGYRVMMLIELLRKHSDKFPELMREFEGGEEFHYVLIAAAAECPITKKGDLKLSAVRKYVKENRERFD